MLTIQEEEDDVVISIKVVPLCILIDSETRLSCGTVKIGRVGCDVVHSCRAQGGVW